MEFVCYEMSVYPQHYLVYLNKPFFEQFKCGVEIYMNEEHMLEIIVRESGEGMIRQKYYSPNLVNRIVDVVKDRRTMHFAFFKDMKMGVWRGILLPKLQESFLWNNLHEAYIETTNLSDFQASRIVYMMKKKYYSFVTLEELKDYYFEKIVLRILSNDEDWKNKYLGTNMREIFLRTRESLRKKACEYYGNEIVKEYMIENV